MASRQEFPQPSIFEAWKTVVFEKYADFNGRARRAEYWYFVLINIAIYIALGILVIPAARDGRFGLFGIIYVVYWLALFIPSLAVAVRRLHDTNKSGWMILIALIPFIGGLILLIFMLIDGDVDQNQYGPSPKYVPGDGMIADPTAT